jgi:hypothetical protein
MSELDKVESLFDSKNVIKACEEGKNMYELLPSAEILIAVSPAPSHPS